MADSLATIATANDVHFGEIECGRTGDPDADAVGPILRAAPGEPPYPEMMNHAVVAEIAQLDPDAVVVKGDLTDVGTEDQYAAFLATYGVFGDRMYHVRGNHDAITRSRRWRSRTRRTRSSSTASRSRCSTRSFPATTAGS